MTEPPGIGDVISAQVRKYRHAKQWSVRRLVEECERLGAHGLTEASLGNIERGQAADAKRTQRRVLVEELPVLARALGVAPILLVLPLGIEQSVEVLPGVPTDTWSALKWWIGERPFPGEDGEPSAALGFYRDHDELVRVVRHNRVGSLSGDGGDTGLSEGWAQNLRDLRKHMRRAGVLPPELPADLADIEQQEGDERGRPDQTG